MITLYGFGPLFGLPDPSPFVLKTLTQLKMSGLPFAFERARPTDAPKGKIPFIRDGETVLGDSVFILDHLQRIHGVDLDAHLTPEQKSVGWAMERMLEDHLYWAIVHARWAIDENFEKGPAQFFAGAPDDVKLQGQENVKRTLFGQGFGRHEVAEIADLASRDFASASALLGDKPFLFGDAPCSKDATLFGFTAAAATPFFDTRVRQAAERYPNLVSFQWRMMDRYFAPAMAE
ncbi:MAG TPA: glutathione S-transferase family protein [Caulobacteraceae bacterium]|jgi:glutathione S-transferase|nr:glutathione S-transferase family protein [Caulobacteraceae bacterium]